MQSDTSTPAQTMLRPFSTRSASRTAPPPYASITPKTGWTRTGTAAGRVPHAGDQRWSARAWHSPGRPAGQLVDRGTRWVAALGRATRRGHPSASRERYLRWGCSGAARPKRANCERGTYGHTDALLAARLSVSRRVQDPNQAGMVRRPHHGDPPRWGPSSTRAVRRACRMAVHGVLEMRAEGALPLRVHARQERDWRADVPGVLLAGMGCR